jgi:hypothetical protein
MTEDRSRGRRAPSYGWDMDARLVLVDPDAHTVRVGLGVTPRLLRRLYGLQVEALVAADENSRTYAVRPAPPLVAVPGGRADEPRAAAVEPHAEIAARKAHQHLAVALGGGGDGHRARPGR